jgi:hypothetical protein
VSVKPVVATAVLALLLLVQCRDGTSGGEPAFVKKEGDKVFVIDRVGERWDVTQAGDLGFRPEGFQYGIGKNAFTPLDDTRLSGDASDVPPHTRVIGISVEGDSKAYSVSRLSRHEVSNSMLGGKPVAVAY